MSLRSKGSSSLARRRRIWTFDDVAVAVEGHVPDLLGDQRSRQHVALVLEKQGQQEELLGCKLDRQVAAQHLMPSHVEGQILELQPLRGRCRAAPQQRPHAREEFREGKWLDEIVVRAQVQPFHSILYGIAGGQKQHGRLAARLPVGAQHRPAVASRQHHIQDDERVAGGERKMQRLLSVPGDVDDETLLRQAGAKEGRGLFVIFYEQQLHRHAGRLIAHQAHLPGKSAAQGRAGPGFPCLASTLNIP